MFAALDVDYRVDHASSAGVIFANISDAAPLAEATARTPISAAYQSGELYRRELPALLAVLAAVEQPLSIVIVDGHVWLGAERPGLGAHLHQAISLPVIGVA